MKIVYYIYINPLKNWKSIVLGQINDLKTVGLLSFAKLYCVICAENKNLFDECETLIPKESECEYISQNQYEYPGLKKLHDLGTEYPEEIFLYMHTKGMVFHGQKGRLDQEIKILRNTINNWKYINNLFNNNSQIDKVGLFPSHDGIFWFNFFWIRGSFLKNIPPPIITNNRYYYEHGFIINKNKINNFFNLLFFDKTPIRPRGAFKILKLLNKSFNVNFINFNFKKYINKYKEYKTNSRFVIIQQFKNLQRNLL